MLEFELNIPTLESTTQSLATSIGQVNSFKESAVKASQNLLDLGWSGEAANGFSTNFSNWASRVDAYVENLTKIKDLLSNIKPSADAINQQALAFAGILGGGGGGGANSTIGLDRGESNTVKTTASSLGETTYPEHETNISSIQSDLGMLQYTSFSLDDMATCSQSITTNKDRLSSYKSAVGTYESDVDALESTVCGTMGGFAAPEGYDPARTSVDLMVDLISLMSQDEIMALYMKDTSELSAQQQQALINFFDEVQQRALAYNSQFGEGGEYCGIFVNGQIMYEGDNEELIAFALAGGYAGDFYVSLMNMMLKADQDGKKNSLAFSMLHVGDEHASLDLLGGEYTEKANKIVSAWKDKTLETYITKFETDHATIFGGKVTRESTFEGSAGANLKLSWQRKSGETFEIDTKTGKISSSWSETETNGNRESGIKYKDELTIDKELDMIKYSETLKIFENIKKSRPDIDATFLEFKKEVSADASILEGNWTSSDGNVSVTAKVGNIEGHASMSAGLYGTTEDGKFYFDPRAEIGIGASVTALSVAAEGKYGDDNFNVHASGEIDVGTASADASLVASIRDKDGNFDPTLTASASAEALAFKAEGKAGGTILGADVDVKGSVTVGVGAHADVGYSDGHLKVDIGAAVGIGVSVGVDIDVGGAISALGDLTGLW